MHTESARPVSDIGIVLLAAGASSRLGQPKQLLTVDNTTLIRKSVEVVLGTGLVPRVVVLGAHKDKVLPHVNGLPIEVVENELWQEGMGSSVKAGLQRLLTLSPQTKAVVLMLCDQPFVDVSLIRSLIHVYQTSGKPIVASQYGEVLGVPALFDQQFFTHLTSLQGDQGARKIIRQHADLVEAVSFEKGKYDIDTMDDYRRMLIMKGPKS
jgi:molybdenum cofactor cytidylyltransferase